MVRLSDQLVTGQPVLPLHWPVLSAFAGFSNRRHCQHWRVCHLPVWPFAGFVSFGRFFHKLVLPFTRYCHLPVLSALAGLPFAICWFCQDWPILHQPILSTLADFATCQFCHLPVLSVLTGLSPCQFYRSHLIFSIRKTLFTTLVITNFSIRELSKVH